ncbi:arginine--tRNA ligase [Moheibacter sp.]|uniref:arginine--tRNA ligase n=1 Tax=Moheibacter sp. TaxID=1965316 RepID=UPI003C76DC1D
MNLKQKTTEILSQTINELYNYSPERLEIQNTRKEFEGQYTLVTFPLIKELKKNPEALGNEIGNALLSKNLISGFNVVKGFLNLSFPSEFWLSNLVENASKTKFGFTENHPEAKSVMVEYSSPNTNKPIHLGHIRNNLLGYSVANIFKAAGHKVQKIQIINDRGIHICKSMIAWEKFGNGETPESSGMKGDHLVGKYYVEFDKHYREEIKDLISQGQSEDEAKKNASLFKEAQEMLIKWEAGEEEIRNLWAKMNGWVYEGFGETYKRLGVDFDHYQYESNTYLLGKDLIQKGLDSGVFYQKEDGSVWIDLTAEGLDEKLVLRSDGTSVYMTQDLGTAVERFETFDIDKLIYVVGNEQDYHFKVLFLILKKLGYKWADSLEHLSYGMVNLPDGKMKSREGTVVDADELMEDMFQTAKEISSELGKLDGYSEEEKNRLYEIIGMGALKYYILKVDPKKGILFDPKESVDFNGNTGPFIQYTYARIQSILRKESPTEFDLNSIEINEAETEIIRHLYNFEEAIQKAAEELSPALIANYVYDLVKLFNSFYQNHSVLKAEEENLKNYRLWLCQWVSYAVSNSLELLGIDSPEKM